MQVIANTNNYEEASKKLNIGISTISQHRKYAENKGYNLSEFVHNK